MEQCKYTVEASSNLVVYAETTLVVYAETSQCVLVVGRVYISWKGRLSKYNGLSRIHREWVMME